MDKESNDSPLLNEQDGTQPKKHIEVEANQVKVQEKM